MKINCYILSNGNHSLRSLIKDIPYLELVGDDHIPERALIEINRLLPNLIFVDHETVDLNYTDFCEQITRFTKVIYLSENALAPPKDNIIARLSKPVNQKEFLQAIVKYLNSIPQPINFFNNKFEEKLSYIYIKQAIKGKLVKIEFEEIYYIESQNNNVLFNLRDRSYEAYIPMKKLITQLPENIFLRIHKSFIVNHMKISHIDGNMVILKDKVVLQIGNTYKESFFKYIENSLLKTGKTL